MMHIDKRRFRNGSGAKSRAARATRVRPVICAAALLMAATAWGQAALADMVVVQQDNTPIASAPGVGGRILTRVDAGLALTVVGREGEWLQVVGSQLQSAGTFWVPAERVSDIIAAPAEIAPAEPTPLATDRPQFRMATTSTGGVATTSPRADAAADSKSSNGISASTARSTQANGARTATAAAQSSGTTASAAGNPTSAVGNPTPAVSNNPTPAMNGNPTTAQGNPTPAVSNNPTPAMNGNPTPAQGNPTPAMGNPTPAMGNPTPAMGNPTPAMSNVGIGVRFTN